MPTPATRTERRLLGLIVAVFVFLAVNQSVLMPLWETPDENEHYEVIDHWLHAGTMPNLTDLPKLGMNEGVQPPLSYWLYALGAKAVGLQDVKFLPRRRFDPGWRQDGELLFLHGPDELFPFAGPALRLHVLRLLSVLFGAATIVGTFALGRRLLPGSGAVGLCAAALVAFNPAFIQRSAGISNDPLTVTLCTFSLVALADLCRATAPSTRRCLLTGLLIGLAHVSKLSASFLLPLVPLALLLRRPRGEPWSRTFIHLDLIVAGFLVPAGPFFAWNLVTYGDPVAYGWLQRKFEGERHLSAAGATLLHFLPEVARSYVLALTASVSAGTAAAIAWSVTVGVGVLGLLRAAHRALVADRRLQVLLLLGVVVNLVTALGFFLQFNQPQARYQHPSIAAFACLIALGLSRLVRGPILLLGGAALALLAFHEQIHVLGPTAFPPSRVHDPHFLCFDPLADVPRERRIDSLPISEPADGSASVDPPTLRWQAPDDLSIRYTVHLSTPGLAVSVRTFEVNAVSVRDRYTIPTEFWYGLPPRLNLVCQVIRLPTLDEALHPPEQGLTIEESPTLILRRAAAPPP